MVKRAKPRRNRMTLQERRIKYASARKDLSKLKAKGLISPKANLRKAKPSSALLKKLEILRPVLTGHAAPVALSAKQRRDYKEHGFLTIGKYTIVKKNDYERVRVSKEGLIEVIASKPKEGDRYMRRVVLPVDVNTGPKFRKFLEEDYLQIEKQFPDSALFVLEFKGHHGREAHTADELYEYVNRYRLVFGDGNDSTFEQLSLYAVDYETAKGVREEAKAKAEEKRARRLRIRAANDKEAERKRIARAARNTRLRI